MITRIVKVKELDFFKNTTAVFQKHLRVILKCYSLQDIKIDEESGSFTYTKSHRINGFVFKDERKYSATYSISRIENDKNYREILLTFNI